MDEWNVWCSLMKELDNPYGVCAIMGNFYIESKLSSSYLQSSYARKLGMTSAEYTANVDTGKYPDDAFIHDCAGYGLAQWTYWSRKEALLKYARSTGKSIGDLNMQIEFFCDELKKYKTTYAAIKDATSVKEASDYFAKHYEKPNDQSEAALKRRSDKAQEYYDKYVSVSPEPVAQVRITADKVNVRTGPGKQFASKFRASENDMYQYGWTDADGWNAIVLWVHPDYSEVIEE